MIFYNRSQDELFKTVIDMIGYDLLRDVEFSGISEEDCNDIMEEIGIIYYKP